MQAQRLLCAPGESTGKQLSKKRANGHRIPVTKTAVRFGRLQLLCWKCALPIRLGRYLQPYEASDSQREKLAAAIGFDALVSRIRWDGSSLSLGNQANSHTHRIARRPCRSMIKAVSVRILHVIKALDYTDYVAKLLLTPEGGFNAAKGT